MRQAPVLVTAFNRPLESRRLIDELRGCGIEKLYVVIDGPRGDKPGDRAAVEEVETMFREIDFVSHLHVVAREENLGCGASPREAISKVFETEEMLIVLEDDCLPSKDFFFWTNTLLHEFADDPRVGAICGFQVCPEGLVSQHEMFWVSRLFAGWGWATWRRGWLGYQATLGPWRQGLSLRSQARVGGSLAGVRWFRANWDWVAGNESDVWDHQFGFLLASRGQVVLKPPINLIENIGINERATHTVDHQRKHAIAAAASSSGALPITATGWPKELRVNRKADRWIMKHDYQAQSTPAWLGDLAKAAFSRLSGKS